MLIGIDGNEANVIEKVGVSTYAYELLWNFYKLNLSGKNNNNFIIYLKNKPNDGLPKENSFWKYKVIKAKRNWILTNLTPVLIKKPRPDVFFTPTHYLPPFSYMPKVFTIHDLGYLDFSAQFKKYDFWQLKYWTAISIFISKYIIAVSNSTRDNVVRQYPLASKKISVIHHGYDNTVFNTKIGNNFVRRVLRKYNISNNYLLFMSTLKPSKNIEGLLQSYSLIRKEFPKYKLVIAGKKGWFYESIFKKSEELGLKNNVIFTDYITEQDKPALFAGAKLFVLPSFWEGFGMDVLNALSCKTPVVVSRIASLPEVAGDAGIYVDPNKIESIAEGIKKVLSLNVAGYNKLVNKGLKQVKAFSWEKTARKTLNILERAV